METTANITMEKITELTEKEAIVLHDELVARRNDEIKRAAMLKEFAVTKQKEIHGTGWYKYEPVRHDNEEDMQDYITESIRELVDIPRRTFSSAGMTETQKIEFLVRETEKIVFPQGEKFLSSIVYDEYNFDFGTQGLMGILNSFVHWQDLAKTPTDSSLIAVNLGGA